MVQHAPNSSADAHSGIKDPALRTALRRLGLEVFSKTGLGRAKLLLSRWPLLFRLGGSLALPVLKPLLILMLLACPAGNLLAQARVAEEFEGPEATLRPAGGDVQFRVAAHVRTTDQKHAGNTSEHIRFVAGNGSQLLFAQPVRAARVIDELQPSLWVKASRPGVQLLVQVLLPRSTSAQGEPISTLLQGDIYSDTGRWQRLQVKDIAEQLKRRLRVLRKQYGPHVDAREAFVDRVVINAYTGPGWTDLWVDDLSVAGFVARQRDQRSGIPKKNGSSSRVQPLPQDSLQTGYPVHQVSGASDASRPIGPYPRLAGMSLVLGHRPLLLRAIRHRGEPLALLRELGFHAAWLAQPPDDPLLSEAQKAGIWLISPPPSDRAMAAGGIPRRLDSIIAWHLGTGDADFLRRSAALIREKDLRTGRPLVVTPTSDLRSQSRLADAVVLGRDVLGTGLDLGAYSRWVAAQKRLARPGTPLWIRVQTELPPPIVEQAKLLSAGGSVPHAVGYKRLRALIFAGLAGGGGGILFDSTRPLSDHDPSSTQRRHALRLINIELQMLERFLAGSRVTSAADCSLPEVVGVALQAERAKMVLPLRTGRFDQYVLAPLTGRLHSYIVPGVPESSDVYEVTPVAIRPLRHKRVTGGVRVVLERAYTDGPLLLTGDPLLVSAATATIKQHEQQAVRLLREIAAQRYQEVAAVEQELPTGGDVGKAAANVLAEAKQSLDTAGAALSAGRLREAYRGTQAALATLARLQQVRWENLGPASRSSAVCGLAAQYATLPAWRRFLQLIEGASGEGNRLGQGSFENLDRMLADGWKHFQHPQAGVGTDVELSPAGPHGGQFSLRLRAWPENAENPYATVETAPVWVSSPPLRVAAGELIRIEGFARVPGQIGGSVDGLMVFDSFGGRPLAHRIRTTGGNWQPFRLYRAVPRSGELQLTFALTGFGEAWIDDIRVEAIRRGTTESNASLPAARPLFDGPPR